MENQELEQYLNRLEYCLGSIPVSDKAEIITEIKSHVMDALENYPDKTMSDILKGLGEPEQVANRYLLERGLEPRRAPKHPVVKWLVIGFLGTFGMSLLAGLIVIWKFSPLVEVNEDSGRVQLMGGLIDVQEKKEKSGKKSKVRISIDDELIKDKDLFDMMDGKFELDLDMEGGTYKGDVNLNAIDAKKPLELSFTNTSLTLVTSTDSTMRYECEAAGKVTLPKDDSELVYDFSQTLGAECTFKVPKNRDIKVVVANGKIELNKLKSNLDLKSSNAKIEIKPDDTVTYNYDFNVGLGRVDEFIDSNDDPNAYKIAIKVGAGVIEKL